MTTPPLRAIAENALFDRWDALLARRPDQVNQIHETDAEVVPIAGTDLMLAITVDTIAEEIRSGFYTEPETIGWMGATVALSDLAAVGATPLGVVSSVTLPSDADGSFQAGIARGLEAACRAAGTYVLGGDTNFAPEPAITGCAAGIVHRSELLSRVGCRPGDLVFASGLLGSGAAAAARAVLDLPPELSAEADYRPRARTDVGRALIGTASACMDTSDGLIATLDQLMRLNGVGFSIETAPIDLLDARTARLCELLGVPPLVALSTIHGEFELVYTVPGEILLASVAGRLGHPAVPIGRVIETPGVFVGDLRRPIDTTRIRNLLDDVDGDMRRYVTELIQIVAAA